MNVNLMMPSVCSHICPAPQSLNSGENRCRCCLPPFVFDPKSFFRDLPWLLVRAWLIGEVNLRHLAQRTRLFRAKRDGGDGGGRRGAGGGLGAAIPKTSVGRALAAGATGPSGSCAWDFASCPVVPFVLSRPPPGVGLRCGDDFRREKFGGVYAGRERQTHIPPTATPPHSRNLSREAGRDRGKRKEGKPDSKRSNRHREVHQGDYDLFVEQAIVDLQASCSSYCISILVLIALLPPGLHRRLNFTKEKNQPHRSASTSTEVTRRRLDGPTSPFSIASISWCFSSTRTHARTHTKHIHTQIMAVIVDEFVDEVTPYLQKILGRQTTSTGSGNGGSNSGSGTSTGSTGTGSGSGSGTGTDSGSNTGSGSNSGSNTGSGNGNGSGSGTTTTAGSGSGSGSNSGSGNSGSGGTTTANGGSGNGNSGGATTSNNGGGATTTATVGATQRPSTSTIVSTAAATVVTRSQQGTSFVEVTSTVAGTQTNSLVIVQTTPSSTASSNGSGSSNGGSSSGSSDAGVIGGVVGGVVGGLALLALAGIIFLWSRRKSRTGHGWFLCFGRRPRVDDEIDWNTFDPASDSAAAIGAGSGRANGRKGAAGGTLPAGFDNDPELMGDSPSGAGHSSDMAQYAGAGAAFGAGAGAGAGAAAGYYDHGRSDDGSHSHNAAAWPGYPSANTYYNNASPPPQQQSSSAHQPSYDHLDPPDVREQRMREQAALAAAGSALGGAGAGAGAGRTPSMSAHSGTSHGGQHPNNLTPGRGGATSPPLSGHGYYDGRSSFQQDASPGFYGNRRMSGNFYAPPPAYIDAPHGHGAGPSSAAQRSPEADRGDDDDDEAYLTGTGASGAGQRLTLSNPDDVDGEDERPHGGKGAAPRGAIFRQHDA